MCLLATVGKKQGHTMQQITRLGQNRLGRCLEDLQALTGLHGRLHIYRGGTLTSAVV